MQKIDLFKKIYLKTIIVLKLSKSLIFYKQKYKYNITICFSNLTKSLKNKKNSIKK